MKLTQEEKGILAGSQGETMAKIMKTVVDFGNVFGATKLVPITHASHFVTSFGIGLLKPLFRTMDEIIDAGIKTKEPFTVDPRPIDYTNVKCNLLNKLVFSKIFISDWITFLHNIISFFSSHIYLQINKVRELSLTL